jgi:excisionase family DNA binding protein
MTLRLALSAEQIAAMPGTRPSLRPDQAAQILQADVSTIYRLIRAGDIEAHRLGKRGVRPFVDSVRAYQEGQKILPAGQKNTTAGVEPVKAWRGPAHREAEAWLRAQGVL